MALTETAHAGNFILSEANGKRSRETVTIALGQNLKAGAVLGKITATGKYAAFDADAATGVEEAAGVLLADVNATGGDRPGVALVRDAEVNKHQLVFAAGQEADDVASAIADLSALGVIAR